MSKILDEFVEMTCPECGGKVKLTKPQVDEHFITNDDGSFTYIGISAATDGAKCEHCGTEFVRKATISAFDSTGGINIGEGAQITVGGDMVGRDKTVVVQQSGRGAVATHGGVAAGPGGVAIGGNHNGGIRVDADGTIVVIRRNRP